MATGAWAVVDQALFAGANFVVNLLLARWLGDSGYGVFGVAYALFLFVALAFTALIIDPMLVFGADRWRRSFRGYLWHLLRLLGALSVAAALLLAGISRFTGLIDDTGSLAQVVLMLCWAGPIIVLQWTLRRACYVIGRPRLAATGGFLYLVALLGMALAVRRAVGIDASSAIAVMAAASLLAAGYLLWRLLAAVNAETLTEPAPADAEVLRTHWVYGRWLLAGYVLEWLAGDMLYLVLAPRHGLAAAGSLRAALNFVMPVLHGLGAISTVAVPWFVTAMKSIKWRAVVTWWGIMTGMAVAYSALLVAFADPLRRLAYGEQFEGIGVLIAVLAALPISTATQASLGTMLRAMDRARDLFISTLAMIVFMASLGIWLTWTHGAIGAAIAIVLTSVARAAAIFWRLSRAWSALKATPDDAARTA